VSRGQQVGKRTRQPDVIILDLGFPDLDGLEIIRRIREWTTVPIIVLSARDREGPQDRAARLVGANDM
jgi:two-component system KDP operon response regulator KdpE